MKKKIRAYREMTAKSLLFTLSSSIWAVRKILIEHFGMSEVKANMAILVAVDVEKQLHEVENAEKGELWTRQK